MYDINALKDRLVKKGISIHGEIIDNPQKDNSAIAFIYVERDNRNLQIPSNQSLKKISENELENDIILEFVLLNNNLEDVESGLRANLLHKYNKHIRNTFLSFNKKNISVWIDPKLKISEALKEKIKHL